jgi:hypothetical protein
VEGLLLATGLFLVYSANGREIGAGDTRPARLLPIALLRGDGPFLDRFHSLAETADGHALRFAARKRGHLVSRYPLAPALLAVPCYWPQVLTADRLAPGWDRDPETARRFSERMAKTTAAVLAALLAVLLLRLLRLLGVGRMALPAVLVAALGSSLWTTASQSLWEHGPAALALTAALVLLVDGAPSRMRLSLAGLATALLVCCRPIDLLFATPVFVWVVRHHRRGLAWFFPGPLLGAGLLIGFNCWFFGRPEGGQAELEARDLHLALHGVVGPWSGNLLAGAAGTLVSPSRGLFIYTPWALLALVTAPVAWVRLRPWPVVRSVLLALAAYFLVLAKYAVWWGGYSFGPRYWTDAVPLFAVLLGLGLEWSWSRCRPLFAIFVTASAFAVAVQVIGAFGAPSSWAYLPANVDLHHERLWDWRDTELTRCLAETVHRRLP